MRLDGREVVELAKGAVKGGNPYIKRSIKFFIDGEERFIYADNKVYTKAELDVEYFTTAMKDVEKGFNERMVGYYDKWYRYNRADEGRAYDIGVRRATEEEKCVGEMRIIECMA